MPQDKRLIVTKAVLFKLQRVSEEKKKDPSKEGIYIFFTLPSVVVAQCPDITTHLFPLPHKVFPKDGRTTCLIVPKVITSDCYKINKRHGYVDAVVTAESICRRHDAESAQRAERVAGTFRHFLVDARIINKLPLAITELVKKVPAKKSAAGSSSSGAGTGKDSGDSITGPSCPMAYVSPVDGLENTESLAVRLSQAAGSGVLRSLGQGQMIFRVGHGGMPAGDICENAKCFIFALKKDYPTVWKYVYEFKMTCNQTDAIRFMEAQIQR
eukprot:gene10062-7032_t